MDNWKTDLLRLLEKQKDTRVKRLIERDAKIDENSGINKRIVSVSVTELSLVEPDTCPACNELKQDMIIFGFHKVFFVLCKECVTGKLVILANQLLVPYNYKIDYEKIKTAKIEKMERL